MKIINKIISSAFFALIIVNQSGCTNQKPATHPLDTLRIDLGGEVMTLDPALSKDSASGRVINDLYAGLADFDQQNHPIPGMASKWDISADGKTYTFHLRHGLKFSNDSPINANDFVYTYRRVVDPKTASSHSYLLAGVLNGQAIIKGQLPPSSLGVVAKDPYTVVVRLVQADPNFLNYLTMGTLGVVCSSVIDRYKGRWTEREHIVTSGAYVMSERVANRYTLLKKNPHFYASGDVHIPLVKFFPFTNRDTGLNNYKAGNLDLIYPSVPINQYNTIKQQFPNELHTVVQEGMYYYDINQKLPQFAHKLKLRQALALAIDRKTLVAHVLGSEQTELYANVTPTIEDGTYKNIQYDFANQDPKEQINQAKKLYAEAGYSATKPLRISLKYDDNDMHRKLAIAIAAMWSSNLGIKIDLEHQGLKMFFRNRHQGNYEIAQDHLIANYNSVTSYTELFRCNGVQNNSQYCNPTYDNLIDLANNTQDKKQKQALYKQAILFAMQDYPIIPLFQPTYSKLIKPYVKNLKVETNHFNVEQSKWIKFSDA